MLEIRRREAARRAARVARHLDTAATVAGIAVALGFAALILRQAPALVEIIRQHAAR